MSFPFNPSCNRADVKQQAFMDDVSIQAVHMVYSESLLIITDSQGPTIEHDIPENWGWR